MISMVRPRLRIWGSGVRISSGAPGTIRTCDLCLRRANVHAPNPGTTHLINSQEWGVASPGQPRHSVPPYSALRCLAKPRYGSFTTSTARGNFEGLSQNWMSHHQIPRLDGDQAERCDDNLPFASRLMALLSITGHWAGQAFFEGVIPFSSRSSNGGFWSRK